VEIFRRPIKKRYATLARLLVRELLDPADRAFREWEHLPKAEGEASLVCYQVVT
jgi:hypothetical protein